jgi:predicted metal-dependent hydrolase
MKSEQEIREMLEDRLNWIKKQAEEFESNGSTLRVFYNNVNEAEAKVSILKWVLDEDWNSDDCYDSVGLIIS